MGIFVGDILVTFLEATTKLILLWLSVDIIIIATGWYLVTVIEPCYPEWWRRYIIDEMPSHLQFKNHLTSQKHSYIVK